MARELRHAIGQGDLHLVSYLIDSGLSINKPFTDGLTPLNYAISMHQEEIAALLLDHDAKIHQPDSFMVDECGRCPIHYAAACNLPRLVQRLIIEGVQVDEVDFGHSTALHHAAYSGNLEIVQYLVDIGSDIDHQSRSGKTAIWKAMLNQQETVVNFLLKSGADVNLQNKVGTTILYDCIKLKLMPLCGELIQFGADPSLTDIEENNALHYASSLGRTNAISLLLNTGILDINSGNEYGNTALHNSSMYNFIESVVLLLNSGANPQVLNRNGHSCLYLTMQRRQYACTQLLHDCGVMLNTMEITEYQQFLDYRTVGYYEDHKTFATWAMQYFNQPKSLFILSIRAIRKCIRYPVSCHIERFRLPKRCTDFILLHHYKTLRCS